MKLWEGRFSEESSRAADDFNQSLSFDYKLYWHDILGSIAHAKMLGQTGIVDKAETDRIVDTLVSILADIEKGILEIESAEDIHTFVESELIKRIGAAGKKLHTGRSRNDQVATDMRLYLKDSILKITSLLKELIEVLVQISENNIRIYMPAYTHLRKAQPISVAHYLNAYSEMFLRDIDRLNDSFRRTDVMPLGSGALAGTSFPIDRELTAQLLSFAEISQNSLDAVSDRDFVLEYLFCASTVIMHLSRFCEELILFSSDEFGFIELADAFCTGSSIMPQKKNPDIPELIRGKSGRIFGHLTAILTVLKGLPLAYNKDLQEDKEAVFDTETQILSCLKIFIELIKNISFDTKAMRQSAAGGYTAATDVADYLVKKGMPFRDAHAVTGKIVRYAIENGVSLEKLEPFIFQSFSTLFEDDIKDIVKLRNVVEAKNSVGGTSRAAIRANIRSITRRLNRYFK